MTDTVPTSRFDDVIWMFHTDNEFSNIKNYLIWRDYDQCQ